MTTIDRSKFMGGSVAAIAAAQAVPASAQSTDFGHTHPPIVPENDPAITTRHLTLTSPDATISAYVAMPKNIKPTTPGIVRPRAPLRETRVHRDRTRDLRPLEPAQW
jgi:hypothetical protein